MASPRMRRRKLTMGPAPLRALRHALLLLHSFLLFQSSISIVPVAVAAFAAATTTERQLVDPDATTTTTTNGTNTPTTLSPTPPTTTSNPTPGKPPQTPEPTYQPTHEPTQELTVELTVERTVTLDDEGDIGEVVEIPTSSITTDQQSYSTSDMIVVTFTDQNAARWDWIALCPANSATVSDVVNGVVLTELPDEHRDVAWVYACGSTTYCGSPTEVGTVTFPPHSIPKGMEGQYQVYLVKGHYAPYPVKAASAEFTVTAERRPTLNPTMTVAPTYAPTLAAPSTLSPTSMPAPPTPDPTVSPTITAQPTIAPTTTRTNNKLQFGDINVVVVTDVHSWVMGHSRHEPKFNATYGDVLSFYQRLQRKMWSEQEAKSLFFVMNGDFMDGTGLSTNPPVHLGPILQHMPWDAINVGNHELYRNDTVEYIAGEVVPGGYGKKRTAGGFAEWWGGKYLTSNVLLTKTRKPIGERYAFLHGAEGPDGRPTTTVLAFGFLYDMPDATPAVTVERVEDVVQSTWFGKALRDNTYHAILVLAHMDVGDPLVDVILGGIRTVLGDDAGKNMPVQFITGHSHIRGNKMVDPCSSSFEAGRYLDTVGFVSFSKWQSDTCEFHHAFLDANTESLRAAADVAVLTTDDGHALSKLIRDTQDELGLLDVVGCSPRRFRTDWDDTTGDDSFWRLYFEEILPASELFRKDEEDGSNGKVLIHGMGAFRYDLFEGHVTIGDVLAVSPYNDTYVLIDRDVPGTVVKRLYRNLSNETSTQWAMGPAGEVTARGLYDLYTVSFKVRAISSALRDLDWRDDFVPEPVTGPYATTTTTMIIDFISQRWPKCTKRGKWKPTDYLPTITSDEKKNRDWILLVVAFAVWVGIVTWFFVYRDRRRRYQLSAQSDHCDSSENGGEPVSVAVFA